MRKLLLSCCLLLAPLLNHTQASGWQSSAGPGRSLQEPRAGATTEAAGNVYLVGGLDGPGQLGALSRVSPIPYPLMNDYARGETGDETCETKYNIALALHNEGIDLLHKTAKLGGSERVGRASCEDLKQAMKLLNEADKKFKDCWKMVKKGITACIDTDGIDAVKEVGDSCYESQQLVLKWRAALQQDIARSCK